MEGRILEELASEVRSVLGGVGIVLQKLCSCCQSSLYPKDTEEQDLMHCPMMDFFSSSTEKCSEL